MKHSPSFHEKMHRISGELRGISLIAFTGMAACSLDPVIDPICGNGALDDTEVCDAEILAYEASCPAGEHLPKGARLRCNANCTLNTSACVPDEAPILCGNGVLDDGEICDADKMSYGASCPEGERLPPDAALSCNADCTLNTDACVQAVAESLCGNGVLDDGEICDAEKLSYDASCPAGTLLPSGMRLSCNANCTLNTAACVTTQIPEKCGNNALDDGEICDGKILSDAAVCPKGMQLPSDASLSCNADCTLNTAACVTAQIPEKCGNNALDEGESCDGSLIQKTAACPKNTALPEGKSLACNANCTLDTSACEPPKGKVVHATLKEIPIHRTPQYHYPNDTLKNDHKGEPKQIVGNLKTGEIVDLLGVMGENSYLGSYYRIQFSDGEYYIHSSNIERVNNIPVPVIDYSSASTPNYYQNDKSLGNTPYRTSTIGEHGGGPTSLANALAILKEDKSITPAVVAKKLDLYQYKDNIGTDKGIICPMIMSEYQLNCVKKDTSGGMNAGKTDKTRTETKQAMENAFKRGGYIIALEGGDYWSPEDKYHFLTVYGYDKDKDTLYVDDPLNLHYMQTGMEEFLNHLHTIYIIENTKVERPRAKKDNTPYRRSPQNKFANTKILNEDHDFGLTGIEPSQIAGYLKKDEPITILGRVKKSSKTPEWYQIYHNNQKYYILASDVETNGVAINDLTYFSGATINYYQADAQWKNAPYSCTNCNMDNSGSAPTCWADAITALLNLDIKPNEVAEKFKIVGAAEAEGGTNIDSACDASQKYYNISCEIKPNSIDTVKDTIKNGGYVIAIQTGKYWTNDGQYVLIYGYDDEDFFVDDPMSRRYHQNANDFMTTCGDMALIEKK
ncbi:MAG: C39 family peptidase [Proteobacteria bacterium]|nr:C39 family peptidase [Pseudomonadota bacterium]